MGKQYKEIFEFIDSKKTEDNSPIIESIKQSFSSLIEGNEIPVEEPVVKEPVADVQADFISALNGDLSREYTSAIQYIQHASVLKGAEYASVIEELFNHANEEMAHARKISDRINYLGGIPVSSMQPAKVSTSNVEMLKQDKENEEESITRYKERIKQAESMGDFGTKNMLMDILEEEEEHRNDLIIFLGL